MEMAEKKTKMDIVATLCEELVAEIFDRIPIKHLTRMKCLSKVWYNLISHYVQSRPPRVMLFCQLMNYTRTQEMSDVICFETKQKEGDNIDYHCREEDSLRFSIDGNTTFFGYSNGLTLSCKVEHYEITTYICDSSFKQWVILPPISKRNRYTHGMGLAFDGIPHNPYKVVLYCLRNDRRTSRTINYSIFSSDTGEWESKRARFLNSSLKLTSNYYYKASPWNINDHPQYLFHNGTIHWICNQCMLVYHLEKNVFKLLQLPESMYGTLWESEGCLQYCAYDLGVLYIWTYIHGSFGNDPTADIEDDKNTHGKWQLKHTVDTEKLKAQNPQIVDPIPSWYILRPCGFTEYMQTLYFQYPGVILAYRMETGNLKVCTTFAHRGSPHMCFKIQFGSVDFLKPGDRTFGRFHPKTLYWEESSTGSPLLFPDYCDSYSTIIII